MVRRGLTIALLVSMSASASAAPPTPPEHERQTSASEDQSQGTREPARLVWEPGWRRFGWANAVVLGVGAGAIGAALLVGPDRGNSSGVTAGAVDEDFRRWVRPHDEGTRRAFRNASDALLAANVVNAYVVDALLNAGWYRRSPDVAFQLAAIDTQVLVVATAVQLWTANLVSRQRPYARLCGTDELSAEDSDCTSDYRYRSFYSGHTSFSFALATATCTHHAHLPLYSRSVNWVPCAAGVAVAAATGASRILADQHYLSDVLVGAAAGGLIGWVIPWLHYATGEQAVLRSDDRVRVAVVPFGRGVAVVGNLP